MKKWKNRIFLKNSTHRGNGAGLNAVVQKARPAGSSSRSFGISASSCIHGGISSDIHMIIICHVTRSSCCSSACSCSSGSCSPGCCSSGNISKKVVHIVENRWGLTKFDVYLTCGALHVVTRASHDPMMSLHRTQLHLHQLSDSSFFYQSHCIAFGLTIPKWYNTWVLKIFFVNIFSKIFFKNIFSNFWNKYLQKIFSIPKCYTISESWDQML